MLLLLNELSMWVVPNANDTHSESGRICIVLYLVGSKRVIVTLQAVNVRPPTDATWAPQENSKQHVMAPLDSSVMYTVSVVHCRHGSFN